jgi:hydrogenase expression/formation protein HypC
VCLAIPGRLIELLHDAEFKFGRVDFGGVSKRVCLEHVPEAQLGEYVLVHVGFALATIDEDEARRVFALLEDVAAELGESDV